MRNGQERSEDSEQSGRGHGVVVSNVSKEFVGMRHPAVDDVSLDVCPGEFMTFLGPSGSGKTTLLSIIAGLTTHDGGSVTIDGHDVGGQKPHRRNLGVVFQQYALFPHMTVAANVAYPLQQRKWNRSDIRSRVHDTLELVRLEDLADRYPRQLSGGQQQRVAIARSVVYEPRALLMDEPLGALDKKLRGELQLEIARMHNELGMTFIFVTHDQHEALSLSDRIAVFNEGLVEQTGTPHELYETPRSLFVAQFIGDSNSFHGVYQPGVDQIRTEEGRLCVLPGQVEDGVGECVVVVRPERIEVQTEAAGFGDSKNRVSAIVTELSYAGDHRRIGLDFGNGRFGAAKYQADRPISVAGGDRVTVSWDPKDQSVVTRDASGLENDRNP